VHYGQGPEPYFSEWAQQDLALIKLVAASAESHDPGLNAGAPQRFVWRPCGNDHDTTSLYFDGTTVNHPKTALNDVAEAMVSLGGHWVCGQASALCVLDEGWPQCGVVLLLIGHGSD